MPKPAIRAVSSPCEPALGRAADDQRCRAAAAAMNPRIKIGKGVTGAVRYVLGEGRDPEDRRAETAAGERQHPRRLDRAAPASASRSRAKPTPSWRAASWNLTRSIRAAAPGNANRIACICRSPGRRARRRAARRWRRRRTSALDALGMGNAKALFVAHNDEDYAHVHIVASKINPGTGRAYDLAGSWRTLSSWAEDYEREHGGIISTAPAKTRTNCAPRSRRAMPAAVLEAMTKQRSTFTAEQLERALAEGNLSQARRHGRRAAQRRAGAGAVCRRDSGSCRTGPPCRQARTARPRATRPAPCSRPNCMCCARPKALAADTAHGIDDAAARRRARTASALTASRREQARAFRHATGAEGLAIIDGQAGTGKSFTMARVREAYEAAGLSRDRPRPDQYRRARTCAATASATPAPCIASCSRSTTAARSGTDKTVVIVDEAAMLDTKLMAMVTAHAHDAGAKLILVGDDRQLSSIDRGGMFGALKDRHGAADADRSQAAAQDRRAARGRDDGRGKFSRRARHL